MAARRVKLVLTALRRANDRLENSLLGDFIGALCLFGTWYLLSFAAGVLQ